MSRSSPSICCTGLFPYVIFLDDVRFSERFRLSTLESNQPSDGEAHEDGCEENCRAVSVPFWDDVTRRVVAVSGGVGSPPNHRCVSVRLYDLDSKRALSYCLGHHSPTFGLASLSTSGFSNPRIISGEYDYSVVLVFDAFDGKQLLELPEPPRGTCRIVHVPEWSPNHVFVSGRGSRNFHAGCLRCYDLKSERMTQNYVGHRATVWGLCACVSQNVLLTACLDKTVRMWSCRDDSSSQKAFNLSECAFCCCCIEEKNMVIVGLVTGSVEVWDIRRAEKNVGKIKVAPGHLAYDIVQLDAERVVCGFREGNVSIVHPGRMVCGRSHHCQDTVWGVSVLGSGQSDSPGFLQVLEERIAYLESPQLRILLGERELRFFRWMRPA